MEGEGEERRGRRRKEGREDGGEWGKRVKEERCKG